MSDRQRVAWAEGMFLRPQHFQQQNRYQEFFAHTRALAGEPHYWGFRRIEIDEAALAVSQYRLIVSSMASFDNAFSGCPPID